MQSAGISWQVYQNMADNFTDNSLAGTFRVVSINQATVSSNLLKVQATETMEYCAREAMQIMGGAGYMRGSRVERIYREVRVNAIGGGSEEIMRDLAARRDEWRRTLARTEQDLALAAQSQRDADGQWRLRVASSGPPATRAELLLAKGGSGSENIRGSSSYGSLLTST